MNTTTYTWEEVQKEAKRVARDEINKAVEWEIAANNLQQHTREWYLLNHLRQTVVEKLWLQL